jgi:hypothetical protein
MARPAGTHPRAPRFQVLLLESDTRDGFGAITKAEACQKIADASLHSYLEGAEEVPTNPCSLSNREKDLQRCKMLSSLSFACAR